MWDLVALFALLVFLIRYYLKNTYNYWEKRKVPCPTPKYIFGTLYDSIVMKKSLAQIYYELYNQYPDSNYVGFYKFFKPGVVIRNPEIIRDIVIKEFSSFHDNDFYLSEHDDFIFGNNPFVLRGPKWKVVRSQLSPSFTSGKVKNMAPHVIVNGKKMLKYIEETCTNDVACLEMKDLATRFTSENVASCAFGLEGNSFIDPDAKFKVIGRQLTEPSFISGLKMVLIMAVPMMAKVFRVKFFTDDVTAFLKNIVVETLKYRKDNGIFRNDFLDFMTTLRAKINNEKEFNENEITAHAGGFFIDGYETSAIVISYALYEMAANPEEQERLKANIDEVLEKYNGELTYEAIQEMEYLDLVLKESLRKNVPLMALSKMCTRPFKLPPAREGGPEVVLQPGMPVIIPAWALHVDEKYYPEPDKFIPERFADMDAIPKNTYMPFGDGPRMCLGMKFGQLQAKTSLATIIRDYRLEVDKTQTSEPLEMDPRFFMRSARNGIWIKLNKRKP
ncbi:PREDICTED: probable cytochrome P450 6a23 [Nicrophorus vespilloides]|uniref:Probable cytochrome P450 6a23 n=1 Tax=Nicrophorus vespilloides TaxID=110193 RepID=A0ABM1MYD7_NICVS|nr:PREDICTED: probable cytochrome P450 6a23 [Nicrophorus vespilloides]